MATTKSNESTLVKEKRGKSPSVSHTNNGKKVIKQSKSTTLSANETTTDSKKPLPNYLKPTFSSINDPLKQVNKHNSLRITPASHPIRRRSFDKPPTASHPIRRRSFDKPPSASRVQSPHVSPGSRIRVPLKSSPSSTRTSISAKPYLEKNSKTSSKGTKVQPLSTNITKKTHATNKKGSIVCVPREEVSHSDPNSTQISPKSKTDDEKKDSLIDEVENHVEATTPCIDDHDKVVNSEERDEIASEAHNITNVTQPDETQDEENEESIDNQALDNEDNSKDVSDIIRQEDGSIAEDIVKETEDKEDEVAESHGNEEENLDEDKDNRSELEEEKKEEEVVEEQNNEATNVSKNLTGQKNDSLAYNNVIEETASKLMKKRQNKVLALAGAFQSVIDTETSSK